MPPRITVIAHVESNDSALVGLVESLDAQSLSYRDFAVVFLIPESAAALRRRLEQLAGRRPNVVIQPFEGHWSDALRSVGSAAATPLVLPLSPHLHGGGMRLHPEALRWLSEFFEANKCDVVFARSSWSSARTPLPFEFRHDVSGLAEETVRGLFARSTLAYRPDFFRTGDVLRDGPDLAKIDASAKIGILGSYPIVERPSGADDSPLQVGDASNSRVHRVTATWRDGRILIARDAANADGDLSCLLSIRRPEDGLEYWLPPSPDATDAWQLDVRSAALGAPLPDGQWSVMINLYATDGEPVARSPVRARRPPGTGIVAGKLVVAASLKAKLVIDVGATKFPPVSSIDADQVLITEDARGAVFTAHLPNVYTTGPAAIDGAVMLDRFRLPARLAAAEREVRLQFFVSGLAGESTLSTQFGAAAAEASGLTLVITGSGEMSVRPTPPPAPPALRKPPSSRPVITKPAPLVTRIRRALPAPLEPFAKRLSRNPVARRVYRQMIRR